MKKILVSVLMTSLLLPHVILANTEDVMLEQVLLKVKSRIEVPEELTQFNYTKSELGYNLTWRDETESKGYLGVGSELDGDIMNYYYTKYSDYNPVAKVDYEEGKKSAEYFLKRTVPEYAEQLVICPSIAPTQEDTYTYEYDLYHEGIKVYNHHVTVKVSKQTGEVAGFNGFNWGVPSYSETSQQLSLREAEAIYLKEIGTELIYSTYTDWQTKKKSSFLTYQHENSKAKGIDAVTGKGIIPYERDSENNYENIETAADKADGGSALTPAEQKAISEAERLLSSEDLIKKASQYFPRVKSMQLSESTLYQGDNQYIRRIYLKNEKNEEDLSLSMNAQTGEILSYFYYPNQAAGSEEKILKEEEVEALLRRLAPNEFIQTRIIDRNEDIEDEKCSSYYYQRVANDILVEDEGISLVYDKGLGEVTRYYKTWSNMDFKKPVNLKTEEEVIEAIGLELVYLETEEDTFTKVYMPNTLSTLINAFTGEEVNYKGEVIENNMQQLYTDVIGHPKEEVIRKLFNSGIYLPGKQLKPDTPILQEEFISLLYQVVKGHELVKLLMSQNDIMDILGDKTLEEGKRLTKGEAVYYMINATPYRKIASQSELYVYPFKDEKVSKELKGYITLAYGLNLLPKAESFKAEELLSRAEAMEMLYYLLVEQNNE